MIKFNWLTPLIVGALLGFGAAMGVTCFCLLSEFSVNIAKWMRRYADRLEHSGPSDDPGQPPPMPPPGEPGSM